MDRKQSKKYWLDALLISEKIVDFRARFFGYFLLDKGYIVKDILIMTRKFQDAHKGIK